MDKLKISDIVKANWQSLSLNLGLDLLAYNLPLLIVYLIKDYFNSIGFGLAARLTIAILFIVRIGLVPVLGQVDIRFIQKNKGFLYQAIYTSLQSKEQYSADLVNSLSQDVEVQPIPLATLLKPGQYSLRYLSNSNTRIYRPKANWPYPPSANSLPNYQQIFRPKH